MTRDDIIRMAREAGFSEWAVQTPQDLERFAALVAKAQRKPLTDEDIAKLMVRTWGNASIAPQSVPEFARIIERAHGIGGEE